MKFQRSICGKKIQLIAYLLNFMLFNWRQALVKFTEACKCINGFKDYAEKENTTQSTTLTITQQLTTANSKTFNAPVSVTQPGQVRNSSNQTTINTTPNKTHAHQTTSGSNLAASNHRNSTKTPSTQPNNDSNKSQGYYSGQFNALNDTRQLFPNKIKQRDINKKQNAESDARYNSKDRPITKEIFTLNH